jgi:hypothetical protein
MKVKIRRAGEGGEKRQTNSEKIIYKNKNHSIK